MATHTKIIDLFGLPACGKTTLAQSFCDQYGKQYSMATMHDLVKKAKTERFHLLTADPLKNICTAMFLRFSVPFNKQRMDIPLLGWPRHAKYYAYAKKYTSYDAVIVDHGDIQDFVSLERGEDMHLFPRFVNACSRYIDVSFTDIYVYCKVETKVAFDRMIRRIRITDRLVTTHPGRIDVIADEKKQLAELEAEKLRFDFYTEMLREKGCNVIEIDMCDSIDNTTKKIMEIFGKKSDKYEHN